MTVFRRRLFPAAAALICWLMLAPCARPSAAAPAGVPATAPGPMSVPAGGRTLIGPADPAAFGAGPMPAGDRALVGVDGPGFDRALRFTVTKPGLPWDAEASLPVDRPIAKGEVVLLRLWARTIRTRHESRQGFFEVNLGLTQAPWTEIFGRVFSVGDGWQEFFVRGVSGEDFAPGQMHLKLRGGTVEQTVELGGIELLSYGTDKRPQDVPNTRATYPGREADATWRAEARQRIRDLRTASLEIRVIDADGRPVDGARVNVEMTRHAFPFGCAVQAWRLANDSPENQAYRGRFLGLFNALTFENALKWPAWVGDWDDEQSGETQKFGRAVALGALQWVHDQGLPFRGHVLMWPSFRNLPASLEKAVAGPDAAARVRQLTLSHIDDVTLATAPDVGEWDVLNEPRDNHELMDLAGRDIMIDWFRRAHERVPDARLALNDYGIITGLTESVTVDEYEQTARYLLDGGAPLGVLGVQGHFAGSVPSPERVKAVLDRLAKLGLPIRVTEYDLRSDDPTLEHDFTRDLLTIVFSHPSAAGFQIWGMDKAYADDGTPTPLGRAMEELVRGEWWTKAGGTTDATGAFADRGYLGRYAATIRKGDREVRVEFDLRKDVPPVVVTLP